MVEKSVKMIAAATAALQFKRTNPNAKEDDILKFIFSSTKNEKDREAKIGMIAAVSKAIEILDKNPVLRDREVLKIVMQEMPEMISTITSNDNLPIDRKR